MLEQQRWLELIGGLFLVGLGVRTAWTHSPSQATDRRGSNLKSAYITTFLLTLTNPATIVSFLAIFAGLGLAEHNRDSRPAVALVSGVFTGSATWWLLLSGGVSIFRTRFTAAHMRWVNRLAGLIIGAFGLLALSQIWS
jgi:threonine/homoserine/homoserine lactone efflux protein